MKLKQGIFVKQEFSR